MNTSRHSCTCVCVELLLGVTAYLMMDVLTYWQAQWLQVHRIKTFWAFLFLERLKISLANRILRTEAFQTGVRRRSLEVDMEYIYIYIYISATVCSVQKFGEKGNKNLDVFQFRCLLKLSWSTWHISRKVPSAYDCMWLLLVFMLLLTTTAHNIPFHHLSLKVFWEKFEPFPCMLDSDCRFWKLLILSLF